MTSDPPPPLKKLSGSGRLEKVAKIVLGAIAPLVPMAAPMLGTTFFNTHVVPQNVQPHSFSTRSHLVQKINLNYNINVYIK